MGSEGAKNERTRKSFSVCEEGRGYNAEASYFHFLAVDVHCACDAVFVGGESIFRAETTELLTPIMKVTE